MKTYKVYPLTTGCLSGTLNPRKLEAVLNDHAQHGWRFVRSIHEQQKVLLFFSREAHFLVFERDEQPQQLPYPSQPPY